MLERTLEPEVMDTFEDARDYDAMDHDAVNALFCSDLLTAEPALTGTVLDVGTGTARIPIELCQRTPDISVIAADLAEHMLTRARENVARAGFEQRIELRRIDAKGLGFSDNTFRATLSNSIVHHIPDPAAALREMWRVTAPGGLLFVRDLTRPRDQAELDELMRLHGGDVPADPSLIQSYHHQRELFRASLCAALTPDEIADAVRELGIPREAVRRTSDRHWTLAFRK